jgi:hypothetical protein
MNRRTRSATVAHSSPDASYEHILPRSPLAQGGANSVPSISSERAMRWVLLLSVVGCAGLWSLSALLQGPSPWHLAGVGWMGLVSLLVRRLFPIPTRQ